jgi:hypothetical protein
LSKSLELYEHFSKELKKNPRSDAATDLILEICRESLAYLSKARRHPLLSKVTGKDYFSFEKARKLSRSVNASLFDGSLQKASNFIQALRSGQLDKMPADEITRACYTIAISFSCVVDLEKTLDQKTPGTFFENFICHLFARRLGVDPKTKIEVLNLDRPATLPTDWIFDLGPDQPKFHLPVKTSTRERVIQVWAHQRVIDGVYGVGRFLGILVCLAETKLDHKKLEVVEICLPDQWRIYQMFIAQMKRVYYLDVPKAYEPLNHAFPRIAVKPLGEFFHEVDQLGESEQP